ISPLGAWMGQTHSISGLKWIPDPESFLPSTIRKRDNPSEHQSVSFNTHHHVGCCYDRRRNSNV
ncbi:hypothetical protein ACMS4G_006391, partial [Escherichia coli]